MALGTRFLKIDMRFVDDGHAFERAGKRSFDFGWVYLEKFFGHEELRHHEIFP